MSQNGALTSGSDGSIIVLISRYPADTRGVNIMAISFTPTFKALSRQSIVLIEPAWLTTKRGRKLVNRLLAAGITLAVIK
jgi:hypothetical protein